MKWFAGLLLVLGAGSAQAEIVSGDAATISVARAYLEAYQRLDVQRLESHYADDVEFNDPTSLRVAGIGGPFVWRGREAVLSGVRRWARSIQSLNYDIDRIYEASGRVVFVGGVTSAVRTPGGLVRYRYPIVTIVTISDGRISEHRDYTDYAGAVQVPERGPRAGQ
ncbi:MAG: nuclear transport factor 2 family protein [Alphaproteobacteria bacterium]